MGVKIMRESSECCYLLDSLESAECDDDGVMFCSAIDDAV